MMTAGGVFTVLLAVGLIPRFAGKTHTGKKVLIYENMVILGTMAGNILSVFNWNSQFEELVTGQFGIPQQIWGVFAQLLLVCFGVFAGIFVGSLAMAIAEMLDSIPIFARRIGFRHGLGIAGQDGRFPVLFLSKNVSVRRVIKWMKKRKNNISNM